MHTDQTNLAGSSYPHTPLQQNTRTLQPTAAELNQKFYEFLMILNILK